MLPKSLAPACRQIRAVCLPTVSQESLNVFHIGQHDAADGDHADIFIGRGEVMYPADPCQQGIHILEGPGNKGQKALGFGRFAGLVPP